MSTFADLSKPCGCESDRRKSRRDKPTEESAILGAAERDADGDRTGTVCARTERNFRCGGRGDVEARPLAEVAGRLEDLCGRRVRFLSLGEGEDEVGSRAGDAWQNGAIRLRWMAIQNVFELIADAIGIGIGARLFLLGSERSESIDPRGKADRSVGGDDQRACARDSPRAIRGGVSACGHPRAIEAQSGDRVTRRNRDRSGIDHYAHRRGECIATGQGESSISCFR